MRLVTVGRRTGREREAIVAYFEDGPNIVTMAMNGWAEGEPAWWLNLLDHSDAQIELKGEGRTRAVRSRAAVGEEHDRLWESWRGYTGGLDGYASRRSATTVVVLEPRPVED
jgi:deazaflavin-dependent oxidoreductase (nitroreductase family)